MNRPKWAKNLTVKLWKHLQEAQETKTPTLRQLREDVEFQTEKGVTCWDCKFALGRTS